MEQNALAKTENRGVGFKTYNLSDVTALLGCAAFIQALGGNYWAKVADMNNEPKELLNHWVLKLTRWLMLENRLLNVDAAVISVVQHIFQLTLFHVIMQKLGHSYGNDT